MTNNQNQQASQLAIVFFLALLLILISSNLLFLALLQCTLLFLLYYNNCFPKITHRYVLLSLFLLVAVLPLLFEFVGVGQVGEIALGWGISFKSLKLSSLIYLRAWSTSSLVYLFLHYIPFYRLCRLLYAWSIPRLFIELLELSYRYSNILWEQSLRMYDAQKLRLGYQTATHRLEHASLLFSQSFSLAHHEAEQVFDGLMSRQFDSEHGSKVVLPTPGNIGSTTPILSARRLVYRYKGEKGDTLKDVSVEIRAGERIVLLGANGAGKSTLMHILSGLKREQRGELYLNKVQIGQTEQNLRVQRKAIALVMQNSNHQLFCPTVEDEIAFGLRNLGESQQYIDEIVKDVIDKFELDSLRHLPPHLLSEGQKKWVSIAAIMALKPQVILMDEPTACLDAYYTSRVLAFVDEFCALGGAVVLSTHDLNLAYDLGKRALVMSDGCLRYDGGLDVLFNDVALLKECKLRTPYGFRPFRDALTDQQEEKNRYKLPLYHNTQLLSALIYGAGLGAKRKAETLLRAGVRTMVVAPHIDSRWEELKQMYPNLDCCHGVYPNQSELVYYHDLIVAATGMASIDAEIVNQAKRCNLLYANLSNPDDSNIHFAASLDKAGLQIAVHSAYRLPELTQLIRRLIEECIDEGDSQAFEELSVLREAKDRENYERKKQQLISKIEYDWTHRS